MAKTNLLILLGAAAGAYYLVKGRDESTSTECREGFVWDPQLRACVQIPVPPVPPVNCPTGYRYDAQSNSCVAVEGQADPVPPQCENGFVYNPETGACEQIPEPPEPSCVVNSLAKVQSGQRVLQKGCKGTAVKELQRALVHFFEVDLCKQYGVSKFDDGKFGPATEKAVKAFQNAGKLTRDGKVGKNTLVSLKVYFDKGNHSYPDIVKDFQDARAAVSGGVCGLY